MEWKKLEQLLPLLILLWLTTTKIIQATTLQKRVGSVFSPTQFGMIHFKHRKSELVNKGEQDLEGSGPRDLAAQSNEERVRYNLRPRKKKSRGRSD
jgi:hypothetical protein